MDDREPPRQRRSTLRPHQVAIIVMISATATIAALQIPLAWRAAAQVDMINRAAEHAHDAAFLSGFDGLDHNLVSFGDDAATVASAHDPSDMTDGDTDAASESDEEQLTDPALLL